VSFREVTDQVEQERHLAAVAEKAEEAAARATEAAARATALQTATTALVVDPSVSWAITERQIYPDRVFGYAAHLEPGIYEMHYLARAVTPGTYRWPGARAYLRAAPEQFGRTASSVLKLQ